MRGIVLFAHGARDPEWALPFQAMRARILERSPQTPVAIAFLERMEPALDKAVDSLVAGGATAVTVFPVFMAQGGHLKEDLPRLVDGIRARHPGIAISLEGAAGEAPEVVEAIAGWVLRRAG